MINYITKIKKALKRAEKEKTMSVKTVPGALDILNQKLGGTAGDIPASSTKEYALEKIYKQLGGTESLDGVNTTAEIIEKIAGVAQGGGGSSDFSTAEVTLVNFNSNPAADTNIAIVSSEGGMNGIFIIPLELETDNETYTVPLYKGNYYLMSSVLSSRNASGDVVYENRMFKIFGNCTFTSSIK